MLPNPQAICLCRGTSHGQQMQTKHTPTRKVRVCKKIVSQLISENTWANLLSLFLSWFQRPSRRGDWPFVLRRYFPVLTPHSPPPQCDPYFCHFFKKNGKMEIKLWAGHTYFMPGPASFFHARTRPSLIVNCRSIHATCNMGTQFALGEIKKWSFMPDEFEFCD